MNDIFIGISTKNQRIEAAIKHQGATPVIIDNDLDYPGELHGIVIPGNRYDVPAYFYGKKAHPSTHIEKTNKRLDHEIELINLAYTRRLPLLAICGGAQLLNVVFGGTLIQHLPHYTDGSINHRQEAGSLHHTAHALRIAPNSLLYKIAGTEHTHVNSDHHQAIDIIGKGLTVNSAALDRTIEGIEHTEHPFMLGVQWHPEYHASAIDALLFHALVEKAAIHAKGKTHHKMAA